MITKAQSKILLSLVDYKVRSGAAWIIEKEDKNAKTVFLQSSEALNLYIDPLTEPDSEPAQKAEKGN